VAWPFVVDDLAVFLLGLAADEAFEFMVLTNQCNWTVTKNEGYWSGFKESVVTGGNFSDANQQKTRHRAGFLGFERR